MKLLDKSLCAYLADVRLGVILLLALGVVRFLMLPVFGIPYSSGTTYTSATILVFVLAFLYFVGASQKPGTSYRDMLGMSIALSLTVSIIIVVAIAIDDFGGIDTYYTDPDHGGGLNPFLHMTGHLVGVIPQSLIFWGLGSVILKLFGRKRQALAAG